MKKILILLLVFSCAFLYKETNAASFTDSTGKVRNYGITYTPTGWTCNMTTAEYYWYCNDSTTNKSCYDNVFISFTYTYSTKSISAFSVKCGYSSTVHTSGTMSYNISTYNLNRPGMIYISYSKNSNWGTLYSRSNIQFYISPDLFTDDRTPPDISYSFSTYNWTNSGLQIQVNVCDNETPIESVESSLSGISAGTVINDTVYKNGNYTYKAKNIAGLENSCTVTVTNIDTTIPELQGEINY